MEVRTEPWPSRRGNGPHPVGWPVQRIDSLACEAAAPVCFGQGFASLASVVPWNRCHPLKRETLTVSPDHGSTCATKNVPGHGLTGFSETIRHTKCIMVSPRMWPWRYGTRENTVARASCKAKITPQTKASHNWDGREGTRRSRLRPLPKPWQTPMPLHGLHIHVLGSNSLLLCVCRTG